MADDDAPLMIDLAGPQGRALLRVRPPESLLSKPVEFEVPPLSGNAAADQLVAISTQVIFTTAANERDGWLEWHVKIYRCATVGDADTLRQHLHRQAGALQHVNNFLPGQRGMAFKPPWAVVPVQVVRGDGRPEELAGAVTTRLGVPSDQIVAQLRRHLPPWLGDKTQPDCVLLAVSPRIDPMNWEADHHGDPHPATENLSMFETLAAGLDLLHQQEWAHCDIKPDNVCRYTYFPENLPPMSEYALIDTDAATRTTPPPRALRSSELYDYRALRDLRLGRVAGPPRAGHLYAQDRFGLMLMVLCALAGREWVEQLALAPDATDPAGGRIADDEEKMLRALAALWPDPRWEPLVRALAEPFGTGPGGSLALERQDPWAAEWLQRLVRAEAECTEVRTPVEPSPVRTPEAPPVAVRAVDRVRQETRAHPAGKPQLVRRAYEVIDEVAGDLAESQARLAMWLWGGGLTGAGLLIALNAFVIGR
ncbi:hypothetical protein JIG36_41695 [Actinoplanes sp. LDG1-06]|uniref:Protein kinase domain-containing protein n=1 Tax=Paractinoplanes ovalisporus TaxID=2810368 RepID=A0ABS2AQ94_9ACTN|nr:hypothetical protein [Actinoplanes ovalisporus]MBM2622037.1 hypothetical protein [Actinoplanes ovalisporus]